MHVYEVIGAVLLSIAAIWAVSYVWMEIVLFPIRLWRWRKGEGFRDS